MTAAEVAVAAVEELAQRTRRAEDLLAEVVNGDHGQGEDGQHIVYIPADVMAEVRRLAAS